MDEEAHGDESGAVAAAAAAAAAAAGLAGDLPLSRASGISEESGSSPSDSAQSMHALPPGGAIFKVGARLERVWGTAVAGDQRGMHCIVQSAPVLPALPAACHSLSLPPFSPAFPPPFPHPAGLGRLAVAAAVPLAQARPPRD